MNKKILILMGRYLPGHKDGGPLRTIVNVTDALGDEYDFYIACLDRDHGDTCPYPDIMRDQWNRIGKARAWYVEPGGFTDKLILMLAEGMDSIYLSSFYDDYGYRTLWLKRTGKIKIPVTLASMGVFSEGALARKSLKKKVFINACKRLGMFNDITWSVTSETEAQDMKRVIGSESRYTVAEDLPRSTVPGRPSEEKAYNGPVRICFLSRICAHKGLDIAVDAIRQMHNDCIFTIYGPVQEEHYWQQCLDKLKDLDKWSYEGDVPSEDVQKKLSHQDVMVLPTKSENYGHVIFEALSVGCIPVISPYTPWESIEEKKAGFIAEREPGQIAEILDRISEMGDEERRSFSDNAVSLAREKASRSLMHTGYREIFNQ